MAAGLRLQVRLDEELGVFVAGRRTEGIVAAYDGTSSLGHVVQSIGVPLTEVGRLVIGDVAVRAGHRPVDGDVVVVSSIRRPQPIEAARFVRDVHLGRLARQMRLLGLDTLYRNDAADDDLVAVASAHGRVLLTQDRGILRRRALVPGPYARAAYVRGTLADDQLVDVLDRFRPVTAPCTRCVRCNGQLAQVAKDEVAAMVPAGTRRSYDAFARCGSCGAVYWRGAHAPRLDAVVARAAQRVIGGASSAAGPRR